MKPGICPDMPFLVNDWLASTNIACMTPAQEGAFLRLLLHAWNDHNCTLPDDAGALATLSRMGKEWSKSGGVVLAMFHTDPELPGRIFNVKQRAVRQEQQTRIATTRGQRTAAANARWSKRDKMRESYDRNAVALREEIREPMRRDASSPVSHSPIVPTSENAVAPVKPQPPDMKAMLASELATGIDGRESRS